MSVEVVYFANLFVNPARGHKLIIAQLTDLVATGLLDHATNLHIVVSLPARRNTPYLRLLIAAVLGGHNHKARVHLNHDNCHEYPGISLAHSLARQSPLPTHRILYFHSKGMTRFRGKREAVELALHAKVIAPWREVLRIFDQHPTIDKVGSSFSAAGWVWWNYWWVRASYLARVEPPLLNPRRHYYEDWLCRESTTPSTSERAITTDNYTISPERCWGLNCPHPCDPGTAHAVLMS